jgi:hypothetical protein
VWLEVPKQEGVCSVTNPGFVRDRLKIRHLASFKQGQQPWCVRNVI